MASKKYKRRKEERKLRSMARIVLAGCTFIACGMLSFLSIKLLVNGIFLKGVENVSAHCEKVKVNIPPLTEKMAQSLLESGFSVFQKSIKEEENYLIAPYTTLMTAGMLENGASGSTLDELQKLLGSGTMSETNGTFAALNEKIKGYGSIACNIKNSIWLKRYDAPKLRDYFLKVNATYYGMDIFTADFSRDNTLNKMNEWLQSDTQGKSVNPILALDEHASMYLLSSLSFNAAWQKPYAVGDVLGGDFKLPNGEKKSVKYMYSKENYLEGENVEGVIKPYAGNDCSFVAIRPTDGSSIYDYVRQLSPEGFKKVVHSRSTQKAVVAIPKFTYESSLDLQEALKSLGAETAFDEAEADFGKIFDEPGKKLYLSEIIQKNYIQLDENGTSSQGVNAAAMKSASIEEETEKSIIFDSPFLYAVIDNETKLPLLLGIMAQVQ